MVVGPILSMMRSLRNVVAVVGGQCPPDAVESLIAVAQPELVDSLTASPLPEHTEPLAATHPPVC